jgi:hypothetical protein
MNLTNRFFASLLVFSVISMAALHGQSPQPIIVRAATEMTPVPKPAAPAPESAASAIKGLEEIKAANAEALKKQEATLSQLDDLQKAAEQLRIFAKRG